LAPPGLCEINLSEAARAADAGTFGVIQGQTAVICPCLIGEGTEPTQFEFFNEGADAVIGGGGETTLASVDFDLRFEGNDAALCTAQRQRDLNRDKVGFYGIGCMPPPAPNCAPAPTPSVVPGAFTVAPNQPTRLIDALCDVQLNVLGCGFFPNETTIICQGFSSQTGVPLQRPGKTVTTAMTLTCDTDGGGVPDAIVVLTNVTPVSKLLVRGTLASLTSAGLPGTAFPLSCCGGPAQVTVTTTFSAGDNNIFGAFTRSVMCPIDLGLRAPVVISIAPSDGNCAVGQNTIITGACFVFSVPPTSANPTGIVNNVTRVFAIERLASGALNPANTKDATRFVVLGPTLIDAFFEFGTVNAGKTFMIFVSGPNGTSRNLVAGDPHGACPPTLNGNEQGVQVTFTCSSSTTPEPGADLPVITAINVQRSSTGAVSLEVLGTNFKEGIQFTVGSKTAKKVKLSQLQTGSNTFNRAIVKKGICSGLPGLVVGTNPGGRPSQGFQVNASCN
jgi:hypothetical protein